jgi:hypothetical protein
MKTTSARQAGCCAAFSIPFSCRNLIDDRDDEDFEDWRNEQTRGDFDEELPFDPEPVEGDVDDEFDFDEDAEETEPPDGLWNDGDWD